MGIPVGISWLREDTSSEGRWFLIRFQKQRQQFSASLRPGVFPAPRSEYRWIFGLATGDTVSEARHPFAHHHPIHALEG